MIEDKALPRAREMFGLTPGSPGFGLDPISDRSALLRAYGQQREKAALPSFFEVIERVTGTSWRLRVASAGALVLAPDKIDCQWPV
ncbi:hypothetical protein [Ornithinimicrobium cryptoxanthini]|uniref:hypothetical protein n=1 Tax=Ornithinimicrobium cryptoxanthini TaxID=2934161 RepID=UPI002118C3D6|nr:hypothetical protein [Ornithinimicrobium cryptoxanthini]